MKLMTIRLFCIIRNDIRIISTFAVFHFDFIENSLTADFDAKEASMDMLYHVPLRNEGPSYSSFASLSGIAINFASELVHDIGTDIFINDKGIASRIAECTAWTGRNFNSIFFFPTFRF